MKKYVSRLLFLLFALLPALALLSFSESSRHAMGLKGDVRRIFEATYHLKIDSGGQTVKNGLRDSSVFVFNRAGFETQELKFIFRKNENRSTRSEFRYQDDSLLVFSSDTQDEVLADSVLFQNGKNGQQQTAEIYLPSLNKHVHRNYTWKNGRIEAVTDLSEKNDSLFYTVYEYFSSGRKKSEQNFEHSDEGRLKPTTTIRYNYDEQGRIAATQTTSAGGETVQIQYTYYDNGEKKSMTRSTSFGATTYFYEYEYDAQGNWVRQTAFNETKSKGVALSEKRPVSVTERKIEYAN